MIFSYVDVLTFILVIYLLAMILSKVLFLRIFETISFIISLIVIFSIYSIPIEIMIILVVILFLIILRKTYKLKIKVMRKDFTRSAQKYIYNYTITLPLLLILYIYYLAQMKYGFYPSDEWIIIGLAKSIFEDNMNEYVNLTRYYSIYAYLIYYLSILYNIEFIIVDKILALTLIIPLFYFILLYLYSELLIEKRYLLIAIPLTLFSGGIIILYEILGYIDTYNRYISISNILNDGYRGDFFIITGIWTAKLLGISLSMSAALLTYKSYFMLKMKKYAIFIIYILISSIVFNVALKTYLPSLLYFITILIMIIYIKNLNIKESFILIFSFTIINTVIDIFVFDYEWLIFIKSKMNIISYNIRYLPNLLNEHVYLFYLLFLNLALTIIPITSLFLLKSIDKRNLKILSVILLVILLIYYLQYKDMNILREPREIIHYYYLMILRYLPLMVIVLILLIKSRNNVSKYIWLILVISGVIGVLPIPLSVVSRLYISIKIILIVSILNNYNYIKSSKFYSLIVMFLLIVSIMSSTVFVNYSILYGKDSNKVKDSMDFVEKIFTDNKISYNYNVITCVNDWVINRIFMWLYALPVYDCSNIIKLNEYSLIITDIIFKVYSDNRFLLCNEYFCIINNFSEIDLNDIIYITLESPKIVEFSYQINKIGICINLKNVELNENYSGEVLLISNNKDYFRLTLNDNQLLVIIKNDEITHVNRMSFTENIVFIIDENRIFSFDNDVKMIYETKEKEFAYTKIYFKLLPPYTKWEIYQGNVNGSLVLCSNCNIAELLYVVRTCG